MKIALYELYKALKSKVLLILFVALFLLNLALSATYTPVLGVPDECIREINKVYLSTSEEEKLSVAESIANKYIKDNVLQNIFPDKKYEDKLNRVKNYNTTIRNIKSEAEQRSKPSVFSKENSFTQLSFKDIFTAYNNVIENKPSFYPDYGTERYINSADTDLMMLVFLFLPLYGQEKEGMIRMVSLFSNPDANALTWTIYFIFPILMAIMGIVQLIASYFSYEKGTRIMRNCSVFLQAFSIIVFTATRQPYATVLLFLFFMIKVILLIKSSKLN